MIPTSPTTFSDFLFEIIFLEVDLLTFLKMPAIVRNGACTDYIMITSFASLWLHSVYIFSRKRLACGRNDGRSTPRGFGILTPAGTLQYYSDTNHLESRLPSPQMPVAKWILILPTILTFWPLIPHSPQVR